MSAVRYGMHGRILAVTQNLPALFRPPYEQAGGRVDRIARGLNLLDVRWNVDSGDAYPGATAGGVARAVAETVRPGSIVLLHDAHPWTPRAVRLILRSLTRQHLRPVTLQTLLELDPPGGRCA